MSSPHSTTTNSMLELCFTIGFLMVIGCYLLFLVGCADQEAAAPDPVPEVDPWEAVPASAALQQGRETWLDTCKRCHGYGLSGAPKIGDQTAWKPRHAKGMATLYKHAIEGFEGPAGTEMPAKGGADNLTDEQVTAAVDYMVSVSVP